MAGTLNSVPKILRNQLQGRYIQSQNAHWMLTQDGSEEHWKLLTLALIKESQPLKTDQNLPPGPAGLIAC